MKPPFTPEQQTELSQQGRLAVCNSTGKHFDWWDVEVLHRYSDCTLFRCPSCGGSHDDRYRWGGSENQRQGFSIVSEPINWFDEMYEASIYEV